ncbi:MAG: GAF domain-containing protein [Leucobacter sp.]|nr:GAF domain-containing protein [Leucobacter sp.]
MTSALRFALRAWYAFTLLRQRRRPQPTDVPAVRSGDPIADRVLVVGNGPSHGWGVLSHQLALTGRLAEAVGEYTHRACDVDLIGAESMDVRSARAWIGDHELGGYDALVFVLGFNDALRLTPVREFERALSRLLDDVLPRLRPEAVVALGSIPPVSAFGAFEGLVARITDRHRQRLNAALQRVAALRGVPCLELPGNSGGAPGAAYKRFADRLAFGIAPRLLAHRPTPAPRAPLAGRDWQWSGTEQLVELARVGGDADLRRLADIAQRSFGVELAVVSLVDGDRLFYANNTDVMPPSIPLDLSFCKYTVESGEPVVIPNTGRDPRFADNPLVDVSFINFYAGYPLRSSEGDVIGSFCLQGSRPRRESAIAQDLLRQLALEAQEVLRRYEGGAQPEARVLTTLARMPAPTGPIVDLEEAGAE